MSLLHVLKVITSHPLNRNQKFRSLVRFGKWQIGSRLVPGAIVFDWINGSKFLVRTGETGLTGNVYTGLHEFKDMGFLLHFLRREDLFIDVGANVGSYTILACSAVGASGIAFEPIRATYDRLVQNMRINTIEGNTRCLNVGVGAEKGVITFTSGSDTMNHVVAPGEARKDTVSVEVTTLDEALAGTTPALMKIDVEGFEAPALKGAQAVLANPSLQAVIMELNGSGDRYGFDESEILAMMIGLGFQTYSYDPFTRSLIKLDGKNASSGNTLFIRDKAMVEERIRTAPMVEINGARF
jgi:FkbM family methyltransferase